MCCAHAGQISGNFDANVRRLQKCRGGELLGIILAPANLDRYSIVLVVGLS